MELDYESRRVKALKEYDILDTEPEKTFDRLTELASFICGTPISLITLLDENRQWFKSNKGLDVPGTPRSISFCTHAIKGDVLFEIPDAIEDNRFVNNPLVTGDPNIRFYAGFPLADPNGYRLGTLCVIDRVPKSLTDDQKKALNVLADEVVAHIVARKERKSLKDLEKLFSLSSDLICIGERNQYFKQVNPAFKNILGWDKETLLRHPISWFIKPDDLGETQQALTSFENAGGRINLTNRFRTSSGEYKLVHWATTVDESNGLIYAIGRDITLQKQTEADLIRTKELLQATSRVSVVGGWDLNLETGESYWSSVTRDIHEVDDSFIPNVENGLSFYSPADAETIRKMVERLISHGEDYEGEFLLHTARGNKKWVRVIGRCETKNEKCVRIYGIIQDINDDKQKQEQVHVSEKRFRQTFDYAPNGMFITAAELDRFIEVNEAFTQITGYTKSELLAIKLEQILHPDDTIKVLSRLEELRNSEQPIMNTQCRFISKNGELVWVEMVASVVKDEEGILINIIGQTKNISARLEAERKLQLSEEKHRAFFQNSQGLMCTHDLQGKFLTVNPSGAQMLGYMVPEVLDKSLYDIVDPQYHKDIDNYLEEIIRKKHVGGLMKLLHKNGDSKTWLFNNVISVLPDGSEYVIGNAVDITDRISLERSLVKAKEIAVKNAQAKDVFLANMSHEIRTPMNAITGFANLLSQTSLNPEQVKYVSYINTAGENLLGIINDILDFSKIESGHLNIESITFNIKDILNNVQAVLSHAAKNKELELTCTLDSKLPEYLVGDPTRLTQVMVNLINNAIKFTDKGFVKINAEVEENTVEATRLHISVKDSGIGIPADKLHQIFNRFTQADSDTTRKYGGTGLGLSIVQSLVKLQGGKVWVESKPGEGSTFHFIISYKKPGEQVKSPMITSGETLRTDKLVRVLLVEDNLLNQKLAMKVLENFNFKAELAENGQEAINKVRKNEYDVILMDLQMPVMDGYQATEIIRNEIMSQVPIIAMTAHSLVGERDKCLSIGMNDYIPKPFRQKEVFTKIIYFTEQANELKSLEPAEEDSRKFNYDISYLQSMSEGNEEFEVDMIRLFIRQTPKDLKDLESAFNELNYVLISQAAHKLTSSFNLMGINEQGILKMLQYEVASLDGREEIMNKLQQLKSIFEDAMKGLEGELAKRNASVFV